MKNEKSFPQEERKYPHKNNIIHRKLWITLANFPCIDIITDFIHNYKMGNASFLDKIT